MRIPFIAAILSAFLALNASAQEQEHRTLTVLSFNARVWTRDTDRSSPVFWKTRMEAMGRMIEDISPDIICFQEMMFPATRYIPSSYRCVGVTAHHPIYVKKGIRTSNHAVGMHWDACVAAGVSIINVHPTWNRDMLDRTVGFVRSRLTGCDVACGDWNAFLPQIREAGFDMANVREYLSGPQTETFINFETPETSHGIIDHFFFDGVTPLSYRVVLDGYGCERLSDHFPVVVKFRY